MKRLAVLIVVVAGIAIAAFFLPRMVPVENVVVKFESFQEHYLFVDENGDVFAQGVLRIPPSKFADYINFLISGVGEERMEGEYARGMVEALARFGFEVENMELDIVGGEAVEMRFSWRSPNVARWNGENWELSLEWADPVGAAQETIAESEVSVVMMGSIAGRGRIVGYSSNSLMFIVLPGSAENVQANVAGVSEFTDYGGGSYSVAKIMLGQHMGRAALIDNTFTFLTNAGQMTITPENLAENLFTYTITYAGVAPRENSFLESLEILRLDLKYGRELKSVYPVFAGGRVHQMTPAQILLQVAEAIRSGNPLAFSPSNIENVMAPENEIGEWNAFLKVMRKEEYSSLATEVAKQISSTGRSPGSFVTPVGKMRFRDVLYTLLRVALNSKNGQMPENILLFPVPSGTLLWENVEVPAKYVYYLLPDVYVKTGTERVVGVLDNLPKNLSLRSLAEEISNWTGSNLTYKFSPLPPTSEETLKERKGQCRDYTNVYLALARTAGLPARRMIGWVTSSWQPPAGWGFISTTTLEGKTVALHAWPEVFLPGEGWIPLEPQSSRPNLYFGNLPYEVYRQVPQSWTGAMAGYEAAGWKI